MSRIRTGKIRTTMTGIEFAMRSLHHNLRVPESCSRPIELLSNVVGKGEIVSATGDAVSTQRYP